METSSCLATAKLPGRGVGAALTLSRAVPLLLLKDGEGECLFSAVVMERNGLPAPWGSWDHSFAVRVEVVLRGTGSTGDGGGIKQTCQKCALAALTTALQTSFLAALYLRPTEEPLPDAARVAAVCSLGRGCV